MRSWKKFSYSYYGKKLFHVAGPTDSRAFYAKIESIRSHLQSKTDEPHAPPRDGQKNNSYLVRKQNLFTSLEIFLKETIYLPRLLSVVVQELQRAGVSVTEEDAVFALRTVGEGLSSKGEPFEKSLSEVDIIWKVLPKPLREKSIRVQYYFLQYTGNIYEALLIIERWAKRAAEGKEASTQSARLFPVLKTDFISGVIAEAAIRMRKPFEFALFLLELFVKSKNPEKNSKDSILLELPIPSSTLSALFLTITNGSELKSAAKILDAQLQLTADLELSTVLDGVQFNEGIVEALLFGCSRATDYEHRLEVAQAYFRRYKDECMLTSGLAQQVTPLMYESLMYIAADLGEIDIHQNLRIEASQVNCSFKQKQLVESGTISSNGASESISAGQYASHLIALARAGFLADIIPSLKVMLENKITPPIHSLGVIIEEIGRLSQRKKSLLTASLKSARSDREKNMTTCYANLPPQYHNGFQMINDVLKLMRSFGLDIYRASSFIEYENARGKTRIPMGSHASFVKCLIEAYTNLGSDNKKSLQPFFLPFPAQYSIDSFCQFESKCDCNLLVQDHSLCRSIFFLFLLRCFPQKAFPEETEKEFSHVPPKAAVSRLPLHELKTIRKITDIIFEEALEVANPENRFPYVQEVNSRALRVQAHIKNIVPKNFIFPTRSVFQQVCDIENPIILLPVPLDHIPEAEETVGFGHAIEEYLQGLKASNRTVIIPFSFVADVHFTVQSHEEDLENSSDRHILARALDKFISNKSNIWYVSFEEELIVRSYSHRRRSISEISTGSRCHQTCTSCTWYFIEGLLELLKLCSGGMPMPVSVYAGGKDAQRTPKLERKLHHWRAVVDLIE
ncbi:transcriptional regulator TetR family [Perkinsela sp. CCAP 1560/4]|nr:transcriptional regulator TetR family [Perkinsela sp. CCAP 1560/4]|eukprot:KNH08310.1 transcriptional regulator TetR family [Perkinsela sp. CCAP 1560/4]